MTKRHISTREQFRAARIELGLTGAALGEILCVTGRTIRRIEDGDTEIKSGVRQGGFPLFCRILEWMLNTGFRPPEFKGRNSTVGRPNKVTKQ